MTGSLTVDATVLAHNMTASEAIRGRNAILASSGNLVPLEITVPAATVPAIEAQTLAAAHPWLAGLAGFRHPSRVRHRNCD